MRVVESGTGDIFPISQPIKFMDEAGMCRLLPANSYEVRDFRYKGCYATRCNRCLQDNSDCSDVGQCGALWRTVAYPDDYPSLQSSPRGHTSPGAYLASDGHEES